MKEKIEQARSGFSREECSKLIALDSKEARQLGEFLLEQLGPLHELLVAEKSESFEHLCVVATNELQKQLQDAGFDSFIAEGNLELGPRNWLVHRINVVKFPEQWVIIDLTARQLPWFKEKSWICEVVLPDEDDLYEYLIQHYHWWANKNNLK